MTTPSGLTPIGAANAAGLAAFAAKSIEDWRQQATSQWQGALGLLQNGFENLFLLIGQIPVIGPLAIAAAQLVQQLIDALVNALGYVGSLFSISNLQSYWTTALTNLNAATGAFAASGLEGAINTAVTVSGDAIGDLLQNLNSAGELVGTAITGAINTAATVSGQAIGTIQANAQGVIEAVNNAADGVASGASQLLADAATNLGLLYASAPQFLQGLSGVFGQTATDDAFAAAAQARADQAAEQARITSAFNAVFNVSPTTTGNVNVTVDFSGMSNASNMSGVMSPGNTNMGITSGVAVRQVTTAGDDKEVFPTVTTSNYQVITVTLGSLNNGYALEIMGRCNSARTNYTCVNIQPGLGGLFNVSLACYVSGTPTSFTYVTRSLSSGGVLKIFLGDPSSLSEFAMQVLYNGTPIITYTDSTPVSQADASHRYVGLRMVGLSGQTPPAVRAVSYQDNPPSPAAYPFSGRPTADVDAKGRQYASSDCGRIDRDNGGAWENIYLGPKAFATAPPSTSWSWVNQGGASVAADADAILLTAPSSTRNWRLRTRSLSPTSNYTATAWVEVAAATAASTWWAGIVLRNSSSGSFIVFGPYGDTTAGRLTVTRWTNATTFSANSSVPFVYQLAGGRIPNWLRIRDDGTNRYFEFSHNGVDWILLFSEGRTAFITPDQFAIGADNEGTGADVKLRLRSLSGIA